MKLISFPPIADSNAQILILGTMPSVKSLQLNQYYGNPANVFWKLMFMLFDADFLLDYDERIKLLVENKVAVWDTLQACERIGSLDSAIQAEVPNDFCDFFAKHPQIRLIVFNGQSAASYFKRYGVNPLSLKIITLPSTSPANAGMTFEQKLAQWKCILEYLQLKKKLWIQQMNL